MQESYGIIYKITNEINGKTYIGQTTSSFDLRYQYNLEKNTDNTHLRRSIKKYGIENFQIDKELDVAYSKNELDIKEIFWIEFYNSNDRSKGYNLKSGGSYGKHSEETKKKISEARIGKFLGEDNGMFGKNHSEISRTKIGNKNRGRSMSDLAKTKISLANFGRSRSQETKDKISRKHKGKIHTALHRINNRNSKIGKTHSELSRNKISEKLRGRKFTEEHKRKLKERCNKTSVVCITTGKIFISIIDAEQFYNVHSISSCLSGKRKSAGKHPETGEKLRWMHYDKYISQAN